MSNQRAAERNELLAFALQFPEAYLDQPWGEDVVKVRGRIFVFLGAAGPDLGIGVKLPLSSYLATSQPFAKPMAYGLGKAGWVSTRFGPGDDPPLELLRDWIDESYRAVAPRKLAEGAPRRGRS
ncbi:MAG TPA: MmcQ/YjbR family DNA-binding protein [Candidatus Limnocylindrales bacterium]